MIEVKLLHGDCLSLMKEMESECVDLILTSPPYNIGKEYEKRTSQEKYMEDQATYISEAIRILSPTGSICWQVGNHVDDGEIFPLDIALYPIFKQYGLQLRNRIIWTFGHGLHCRKRLSGRYETILWFTKSNDYTFNLDPIRIPSKYPNKKHYKGPNKGKLSGNPLGKNPSDVWEIPNVKHNHPEKTEHPCQFPEELCKRLILSLTNENDVVLDPFMGSGTTGKVSIDNNRSFVGMEMNDKYFEISKRRIIGEE